MLGLFFIGLIMTTSYRFLSEILKVHQKMEKIKTEIEAKHFTYIRLNQIFSALSQKEFWMKDHNFFDEKTNTLNFLFDNGIDPDPNFSGYVYGTLYLSKDMHLCLNIFPLELRQSKRVETLLKNIKSLQFSFFSLEEKTWKANWPKKEKTLPVMLYLRLESDEKDMRFSYYLPSFPPVITYKEKQI